MKMSNKYVIRHSNIKTEIKLQCACSVCLHIAYTVIQHENERRIIAQSCFTVTYRTIIS